MDDRSCADFREALDDALTAAEAGGLALEVQITLMLSELGRLIASSDGELEFVLARVQKALDHATRTALRDLDDSADERFGQRSLN